MFVVAGESFARQPLEQISLPATRPTSSCKHKRHRGLPATDVQLMSAQQVDWQQEATCIEGDTEENLVLLGGSGQRKKIFDSQQRCGTAWAGL